MRVSATDRIIREAEQHDSAAVRAEDGHPDTEKVTAAPLLSVGFPSPRMPTPLGGVDVLFDQDEDDEGEEGETQVDAKRSAAALDQMRAMQEGGLTPPPVVTRRSGVHRGLPTGRPVGGATGGLTPSLVPLAPEPSPHSTLLMFGPAAARLSAIASASALARPLSTFDQPSGPPGVDRLRPSPPAPFSAVPAPTPPAVVSSPARARGVSRRAGFAITAATAAAVTVIVGGWTARDVAPARQPSAPSPSLIAPTSPGPGQSAVTRPAGPAHTVVPPASPVAVPASAPSSPSAVDAPAPLAAAPLPPAPAAADTSPPPVSRRAQPAAKPAKLAKARLAKKRATATKRNQRGARPSRAMLGAGAAPGSASSAGPSASRRRSDPDDTLPISD